jgi:hypothetical protein
LRSFFDCEDEAIFDWCHCVGRSCGSGIGNAFGADCFGKSVVKLARI